MSRPLYELSAEYAALLDANDGEIDNALVMLSDAIEQKAASIAHVLAEIRAESAAVASELERLEARQDAIVARHDKVRDYLIACMEAAGITKVKHALFTIALQENPPRVDVYDEQAVPAKYQREKLVASITRAEILADYKRTGEVPPGCEIKRGVSLRIK